MRPGVPGCLFVQDARGVSIVQCQAYGPDCGNAGRSCAAAGPSKEPAPKKKASRTWAILVARIFEVLPLLCLRCNAPMKIIAFITEPATVAKILEHIGEPSTAPVIAPARAPPQEEFAYDA